MNYNYLLVTWYLLYILMFASFSFSSCIIGFLPPWLLTSRRLFSSYIWIRPHSPDWSSPSPRSTGKQATSFILSPWEALDSHFDSPCGWGLKPWPCLKPLGAHKIHPVTKNLTKNFHLDTLYWYGRTLYSAVYHHTFFNNLLRPAREVAGAEIASLS